MSVESLAHSIADAASLTSLSKATLWRHIAAGDLHTFKIGCRTLIRADELRGFIDRYSKAA